ncbi:MAG: carboxypeptidase, partial [Flavobacteriaceae bacterium]|nr:carboxypeptidase [Flavobacteriaceae bacterium]
MKKHLLYLSLASLFIGFSQSVKIPVDTMVITTHSTIVKGVKFDYTAETGMQPVWDKDGQPIASLFYTYYTRNNIKNKASRPLIISFNGGPGSASVWMHIAYTG